jgi:hypothetical protein
VRARYVRHRLLQLLEDAHAARLAAELARAEIPALRAELEQSATRVAKLETALAALNGELQAGRLAQQETRGAVDQLERELQRYGRVLELLYEEEAENLRRLHELRRSAAYGEAFTDPQPLVSVIIPTYLQHELLLSRAIPSVLGQTHREIEVVVVGDGAPEATARAIAEFGDERVRYENLTVRAPYPEDPGEFWRVAGTPPWNAAWELAAGSWIAPLNDDDAFRPDHNAVRSLTAQSSITIPTARRTSSTAGHRNRIASAGRPRSCTAASASCRCSSAPARSAFPAIGRCAGACAAPVFASRSSTTSSSTTTRHACGTSPSPSRRARSDGLDRPRLARARELRPGRPHLRADPADRSGANPARRSRARR